MKVFGEMRIFELVRIYMDAGWCHGDGGGGCWDSPVRLMVVGIQEQVLMSF